MSTTTRKIRHGLWTVAVFSFLTPAISLLVSFGWEEFNSRTIGEVDSISSLLLLIISGSTLSGIHALSCLVTALAARWIKEKSSLLVMLLLSIALLIHNGLAIWGHTDRRAFFYILLFVNAPKVVISLVAFLILFFKQRMNTDTQ